jgi:hypothetical protein
VPRSAPSGVCSWVLCCIFVSACAAQTHQRDAEVESDAGDASEEPSFEPGAIAVLPDTQFYACAYSHIFRQQTAWLGANAHRRGIAAVIHTGDIVDADIDAQWLVAADSMSMLGALPFTLTSGNHDLSAQRASLLPNYFMASELDKFSDGAGSFDGQRIENSYAVTRVAGRSWLLLGLEFAPRDAVVAWAAQVLQQYAAMPTILFTHAYLYSDGRRYDRSITPPQPYHPDVYGFTPEQGVNDGEDLWRKLIEPHANVKIVLSGHVIPIGTAHSSAARADGSLVHQILANYQRCDACPCAEVEGGGGYLRLLELREQSVRVSTYSPYYDRWLKDPQNSFELPLLAAGAE